MVKHYISADVIILDDLFILIKLYYMNTFIFYYSLDVMIPNKKFLLFSYVCFGMMDSIYLYSHKIRIEINI